MPTLQVTPDGAEPLQVIADALWKARKVVVITGAGISTNSGIPDFRSENGLYSLIQAQFEAAASRPVPEPLDDATPTNENDATADALPDDQQDDQHDEVRPAKRRKLSPETASAAFVASSSRLKLSRSASSDGITRRDSQGMLSTRITRSTGLRRSSLPGPEAADAPLATTAARPDVSVDGVRLPQLAAPSSPPAPAAVALDQPPDNPDATSVSSPNLPPISDRLTSVVCHTTPKSAPQSPTGLLSSSSPLSSPPRILLDPFASQEYSPSTSQNSTSASSEVGETPPSTAPTSQGSRSSGPRSSLPNMKGKDLFDVSIWSDPRKTSVFYTFATTLRRKIKNVEPTTTHHFLSHLRNMGKLVRCYTQNIDEIEGKVGLSTNLGLGTGSKSRFSTRANRQSAPAALDRSASDPGTLPLRPPPNPGVECVYLHGSLSALRCFVCSRTSDWEEANRESQTMSGGQPACPHCGAAAAAREGRGKRALGVGKLRPDIVLYGEEHPSAHLISPIIQHDLQLNPDMLLIMGTSLRVHGLKVMVREFAKAVHSKGGMVVFVNLTRPSESVWTDVLDYWVQWDCDAWVDDLKSRKPIIWQDPETILEEREREKERRIEEKERKIEEKEREKERKAEEKERKAEEKERKAEEKERRAEEKERRAEEKGRKVEEKEREKERKIEEKEREKERKAEEKERKAEERRAVLLERQTRPRKPPPLKEPKLRDAKDNIACVLWRIHASLARLGGRPNTYAASTLNPLGYTLVRKKKATTSKRRSLAAGVATKVGENVGDHPPRVIGESSSDPGPDRTIEVRPIPPRPFKAKAAKPKAPKTKNGKHALEAIPRPRPKPISKPEKPFNAQAKTEGPTLTLPPLTDALLGSSSSALLEAVAGADGSIAHAIKSNPRKRKRKMIDGVEVSLTDLLGRSLPPRPPPEATPKENENTTGASLHLAAQPPIAAAPKRDDPSVLPLPVVTDDDVRHSFASYIPPSSYQPRHDFAHPDPHGSFVARPDPFTPRPFMSPRFSHGNDGPYFRPAASYAAEREEEDFGYTSYQLAPLVNISGDGGGSSRSGLQHPMRHPPPMEPSAAAASAFGPQYQYHQYQYHHHNHPPPPPSAMQLTPPKPQPSEWPSPAGHLSNPFYLSQPLIRPITPPPPPVQHHHFGDWNHPETWMMGGLVAAAARAEAALPSTTPSPPPPSLLSPIKEQYPSAAAAAEEEEEARSAAAAAEDEVAILRMEARMEAARATEAALALSSMKVGV